MLETLKNDGIVFTKDIMSEYRAKLHVLKVERKHHNHLCNSLTKYVSSVIKNQYQTYVPPSALVRQYTTLINSQVIQWHMCSNKKWRTGK